MPTLLQLAQRMKDNAAKALAGLWSDDVKPKWHPPKGLFTKDAKTIARTLLRASSSEAQAASRLTFYMNRAGKNLKSKDRTRLSHALALIESKK